MAPKWAEGAVGTSLQAIEDFTKRAQELASNVEDGTIELTAEEKLGLARALNSFEAQADRLRLQLPGSVDS